MLHHQSVYTALLERQVAGGPVHRRPFVREFECEGDCSGTILTNACQTRNSPVFGLKYSSVYTKLLAMADEDGYVSVVNTTRALPESLDDNGPNRACAQWTAHRNAIFELSWANSDIWMYTASGDMTLALWDTAYANRLARFRGHTGSVKTLSVSPCAPQVMASGGRDGLLILWDSRTTAVTTPQGLANEPVAKLVDPHAPLGPTARSRGRGPLQGRPAPSVTAVQFLTSGSGHVLASGGVDGIVRLWDVRNTAEAVGVLPARAAAAGRAAAASLDLLAASSAPRLGVRDHAVTSLALHPDGAQLLVSLTGGHHLLYNSARPDAGPMRWYGGHSVASFYIKAAFSPDGSHFVSGSSDNGAYVWQVEQADGAAPYVLPGHEREVTTAAWCPTDFCQLATAADDCTVKVWNVHRRQRPEVPDPPARRTEVAAAATTPAMQGAGRTAPAARSEGWDFRDDRLQAALAMLMTGPFAEGRKALLEATAEITPAPLPGTAVGGQAVAHSTSPRPAPPTAMRISNALRQAGQGVQRKRTKQQTLAQALGAARTAAERGPGGSNCNAAAQGAAADLAVQQAKRAKHKAAAASPGSSAEVRRPSSVGCDRPSSSSGSQDENANANRQVLPIAPYV